MSQHEELTEHEILTRMLEIAFLTNEASFQYNLNLPYLTTQNITIILELLEPHHVVALPIATAIEKYDIYRIQLDEVYNRRKSTFGKT